MSYSNNEDIANALNERARDNALRVFVSGLRRPLSDILFSARPADLPTALATAQELESDQKRQEFARIFATGDGVKTNQKRNTNFRPMHPSYKYVHPIDQKDTVKPMDIDPGSSTFRRPTLHPSLQKNLQQNDTIVNKRRFEDSGRTAPAPKAQRVNYLDSESVEDYEDVSSLFENEPDEEEGLEQLNFLE